MSEATSQHILILCATERGRRCVEHVMKVVPQARLTVVSFREETWEPPYLESIKRCACSNGHRFFETKHIEKGNLKDQILGVPVDIMIAISWRYLVPPDIAKAPKLGSYVLHDSLLPKYRGFSPTAWALINGGSYAPPDER